MQLDKEKKKKQKTKSNSERGWGGETAVPSPCAAPLQPLGDGSGIGEMAPSPWPPPPLPGPHWGLVPTAAPPTAAAQRHRCREPAVPREMGVGGCGGGGPEGSRTRREREIRDLLFNVAEGGQRFASGEGELGNMQPRNNGLRHLRELNSSSTQIEYTVTRGPYTNPQRLPGRAAPLPSGAASRSPGPEPAEAAAAPASLG